MAFRKKYEARLTENCLYPTFLRAERQPTALMLPLPQRLHVLNLGVNLSEQIANY